jgi:hypothetical protein
MGEAWNMGEAPLFGSHFVRVDEGVEEVNCRGGSRQVGQEVIKKMGVAPE